MCGLAVNISWSGNISRRQYIYHSFSQWMPATSSFLNKPDQQEIIVTSDPGEPRAFFPDIVIVQLQQNIPFSTQDDKTSSSWSSSTSSWSQRCPLLAPAGMRWKNFNPFIKSLMQVPLRFTRHSNVMSIDQFEDNTLHKIFSSEIGWWLKSF